MIRRLVRAGAALALLLAPLTARAHAVVFPRQSTPGAYERYVLRVPNEKAVATTRIEIRFPVDVRVVSFADVPGWTLEVVRDSAHRIVAAVWTGTLAPERFVELPFVAVNPRNPARLVWPAFQTYAGGERVEWTGAPDAKTPASATDIAVASSGAEGRGESQVPLWIAIAALLLALLGLGVALRRDAPAAVER